MSARRYTEAFKVEAVKQVTERGHSVADVANRLGVTTHSLYEWLRKCRTAFPHRNGGRIRGKKRRCASLKQNLNVSPRQRNAFIGISFADINQRCQRAGPLVLAILWHVWMMRTLLLLNSVV